MNERVTLFVVYDNKIFTRRASMNAAIAPAKNFIRANTFCFP